MHEKEKVIIAIKDLLIAHRNIKMNIADLVIPENRDDLSKICDEIMMSIAGLKDYNNITDEEISFDN